VLTDSTRQLIDGNVKLVGMLGIGATINMKEASLSESFFAGVKRTYYWLKMMLDSLKALVTGGASFKDFVGPIFFAKVAGETAQNGLVSLLGLMALLSVNLGLINILPIPGLDGGHALLALVEGISRRKLPLNVKMGIQQIGVLFLLLLFVYIFVNDILRLF
jgi:regulator of sigma E protease